MPTKVELRNMCLESVTVNRWPEGEVTIDSKGSSANVMAPIGSAKYGNNRYTYQASVVPLEGKELGGLIQYNAEGDYLSVTTTAGLYVLKRES